MYSFRFFKDYRQPIECANMDEFKYELRCWAPCTTKFRAINRGLGKYIVLRFSPHIVGPCIEGYLTIESEA